MRESIISELANTFFATYCSRLIPGTQTRYTQIRYIFKVETYTNDTCHDTIGFVVAPVARGGRALRRGPRDIRFCPRDRSRSRLLQIILLRYR